ncbi:MAG: energy transducer TonB, partial [Rhodanobacter sp.]
MSRFLSAVSHRYALAIVSLLVLAAAVGIFWHSQAVANASSELTAPSAGAVTGAPAADAPS